MGLMAEMIKTLGKVADLLVPTGPPEVHAGRFDESWMVERDEDEDEVVLNGRPLRRQRERE